MRAGRDVRSLSEFRSNAAAFVEQVRSTSEPVILTQRGRGAAVLLGIDAYDAMLDEIGLFRDLRISEHQADRQNTRPRELAETRLRAIVGR